MSSRDALELALIPAFWTGYFVLHSVLASARLKACVARRWSGLSRLYRLVYNGVALATLVPLLGYTASLHGHGLWSWTGPWRWVSMAVLALSLAGALWSTRAYDMVAFVGLRGEATMPFRVSGMHRVVRHPWYFFALCILWTRDMNAAGLVQTVCFTFYLVIGSRLEERRLVHAIGDAYAVYLSKAPGLIPQPWRYVTADDLQSIRDAG